MMSADPNQKLAYDPDTLHGLSDHVMVLTTLMLPQLQTIEERKQAKQQPEIIYKWVEGTCIQNYTQSA